MNLENEKELVERAKKDPKAFSEIYEFYYPKIFGYILKRVANVEVAKDIVSETFFKVLKILRNSNGKEFLFHLGFLKLPRMKL